MRAIFLLGLCACLAFGAGFSESKTMLKEYYYVSGGGNEFYCGAPFRAVKKGGKIKLQLIKTSAYTPMIESKNDHFDIDWEHIVPVSVLGKDLSCWKDGGRKQCAKNPIFKQMEGDVMNIVPSIARINRDRKNYEYDDAPDDAQYTQYGACAVLIDSKKRKIYPRAQNKGYIARSYLYMIDKYGVKISDEQLKLMKKWNELYPITQQEKQLRRAMADINRQIWINDVSKDAKKIRNFFMNF